MYFDNLGAHHACILSHAPSHDCSARTTEPNDSLLLPIALAASILHTVVVTYNLRQFQSAIRVRPRHYYALFLRGGGAFTSTGTHRKRTVAVGTRNQNPFHFDGCVHFGIRVKHAAGCPQNWSTDEGVPDEQIRTHAPQM